MSRLRYNLSTKSVATRGLSLHGGATLGRSQGEGGNSLDQVTPSGLPEGTVYTAELYQFLGEEEWRSSLGSSISDAASKGRW